MDNEQKREKIMQTKRFLDVAIACCCKEQKQPSLYFFRGLLHYQLHNFYDALNDFNIAIQEEEEEDCWFALSRAFFLSLALFFFSFSRFRLQYGVTEF